MRGCAACLGLLIAFASVAEPAMAQWRWGVGLSGGYETGGKIYRARSSDLAPVWPLPGGTGTVAGTEVRAEIDGFASFGVRATTQHERGYGAILSVSIADLDVSVIRRTVAENVEKVPWDQFLTVSAQLVGTWSLIPAGGNTPYLLAGFGLTTMGSEGAELDQSSLTFVLGAGFRMPVSERLQIDLEFRDTFVGLDLDDEAARLDDVADSFEAEDRVQLLEVSASASLMF